MKGLRLLDRRVGFSMGALIMLAGMVAPAILPAFASAAQISSRSIQMSDSTGDAPGVSYTLNFTPTQSAADMIVYFCDDTPLVGASCGTSGNLAGFSLSGVSTSAGTIDSGDTGNPTSNAIAIKGLSLTTSATSITLSGVHNPTAANVPFYARIETFDATGFAAQELAWTGGPTDTTNMLDNGSVALSTTSQIGVQADVLESLQFCTFGDTHNGAAGTANSGTYLSGKSDATGGPTANCGANSNPAPSITLGQTVSGSTVALSTTTPSYGAGWSQISTNASGGALVYLKDNTLCGGSVGLVLNNGSTCGIPEENATGVGGTLTAGVPGFGITFGGGATPAAFAAPSTTATGGIDFNSNYTSKYSLTTTGTGADSFNSNSNAINGVTQNVSTGSGAPVFETDTGTAVGPATNWDIPFGVGASIGANTPAGQYKANLSLIAVGTF